MRGKSNASILYSQGATQRSLDVDCPICFETFEESERPMIVFCKVCGNNIHKARVILVFYDFALINKEFRLALMLGNPGATTRLLAFTADRSGWITMILRSARKAKRSYPERIQMKATITLQQRLDFR